MSGLVASGCDDGPDLVERDVAGSIDADGERERAGGIADVAFDHRAVVDEHDRLSRWRRR